MICLIFQVHASPRRLADVLSVIPKAHHQLLQVKLKQQTMFTVIFLCPHMFAHFNMAVLKTLTGIWVHVLHVWISMMMQLSLTTAYELKLTPAWSPQCIEQFLEVRQQSVVAKTAKSLKKKEPTKPSTAEECWIESGGYTLSRNTYSNLFRESNYVICTLMHFRAFWRDSFHILVDFSVHYFKIRILCS